MTKEMKRVTVGSLTVDALEKQVRYQEPGLLLTGTVDSVEHSIAGFGLEKRYDTNIRIKNHGSNLYLRRPASTEIEIEDAD